MEHNITENKNVNRYIAREINKLTQYRVPDIGKNLNVCVYYRLSPDLSDKKTKREKCNLYYGDLVCTGPGWKLVDIFVDESYGRDPCGNTEFNKMIENCKNGKYDLIITPKLLMFRWSLMETVAVIKELSSLPKPVSVYFEIDSICTYWNDHIESKLPMYAIFEEWCDQQRKCENERKRCIDYSSTVLHRELSTIQKAAVSL